jgi:hypothetical protein
LENVIANRSGLEETAISVSYPALYGLLWQKTKQQIFIMVYFTEHVHSVIGSQLPDF